MVFKHQHFHETPPEVEAEFPPSATLEGAVSDALASAGGVDASDVTVTASGSEITLSGTVQLESEVARAEEVALGVAGVATVRNEIRFTRPR
ncbi:BON domain-containing protein [Neorhizobium galegae]|uniref:BON domain-containing protein n=1 Tax=Neorhizobium galegae TaxID=399 RepID=UPI0006214173|nr:BON domain-containing protein [Neorhizobium galegae]MCQ1766464.1 BON domain-containing protein [Neorhizobium galegae]MCQ1845378.1 BON domain-containing protein [Neorhizobium galegae]CDZ36345.1 Putative periplasmic or secreted lipoprotein [Neorhizobium galegae bv. officinalis]